MNSIRIKVLITLALCVILSLSFSKLAMAMGHSGYSSYSDPLLNPQMTYDQEQSQYNSSELPDMDQTSLDQPNHTQTNQDLINQYQTNTDETPTQPVQTEQQQRQQVKPKRYINGFSVNGHLMVPIRKISDTLDLQVKYEAGKLVIENFATRLEVVTGSKKYIVNGYEFTSDNETIKLNGQNYVQFSMLAKVFNLTTYHNQLYNWIEISGEKEDLYIYIKPETSMYAYKPQEIVSLMYHHFEDGPGNGVIISSARFREHLGALKEQGYETITERDYLDYQQGKTNLPQKPLMITIDDGYLSNYLEAFPVLAEEGYKATVYLTTSKTGTKPAYVEYMSWEQMKEMVASEVIDIQSHTHDLHYQRPRTGTNRGYALVDRLPYENEYTMRARIKEDMRLSKKLIEENVGNKVFAFAYPYGVYNEAVIKMLKEEGYQLAFTITQGKNNINNSPMVLKRYTADGRYTGEQLISKIK